MAVWRLGRKVRRLYRVHLRNEWEGKNWLTGDLHISSWFCCLSYISSAFVAKRHLTFLFYPSLLDDCYQLWYNCFSNTLPKNKERIFKFTFASEHIGKVKGGQRESKCSHDSPSSMILMSPFFSRWHHPMPSSLCASRFYPLVEN